MSAEFTLPLKATRTAVYDTIYDAEDRLVCFITIADDAQARMRFIVKAVNEYQIGQSLMAEGAQKILELQEEVRRLKERVKDLDHDIQKW